MTPDEYRKAAIRTEARPVFMNVGRGFQHDIFLSRAMHALLGMMSELGELADAFKKHIIYNAPLDQVNVVEEIGDLDWYRAVLADALNVGFEESWKRNIAKLKARYPDKFESSLALNRDLDAERAALEQGLEGNPKG